MQHFASISGCDHDAVIDQVNSWMEYFDKNYSNSPFADTNWLFEALSLDKKYMQNPLIRGSIQTLPLRYIGILSELKKSYTVIAD